MHTIKIGENTFELELIFGGKKKVNEHLEREKIEHTVDDYLQQIWGYVRKVLAAKAIEDEEERKNKLIEVMSEINDDAVLYCLWALMINKNNYHDLTYEKFFDIVFDINRYYNINELINIIIEEFAEGMVKKSDPAPAPAPAPEIGDQKKKE